MEGANEQKERNEQNKEVKEAVSLGGWREHLFMFFCSGMTKRIEKD